MSKDDNNSKVAEPSWSYEKEYTYADYLTWHYDYMVEIIRGKVFKMTPAPSSRHQIIAGNLYLSIGNYLKEKACHVFIAPYDIILPIADKQRERATTVVQPDLCVICNADLIEERGCFGVPDWIIEILSPSTSKKDLQDKFNVYEEAGVREYWIVMPKEKLVEIFILKQATFDRVGTFTVDEVITSEVLPELEISLSEIFPEKI